MTKIAIAPKLLVGLMMLLAFRVAEAWDYLEPIDTASPRATMASFVALTEEAARRLVAYRDSPSPLTLDRIEQIGDQAQALFDLSQVAPALQREVANDTFYLLWDALARTELPNPDAIPGEIRDEVAGDPAQQSKRWRMPRTAITIARIDEGPSSGQYLFSAGTVKEARHFYEAVRDLPYRRPMPVSDVYRLTRVLAGWMIPPKFVEALPGWLNKTILGQVLWKWLALLLLFALAFALTLLIFRRTRRAPRDGSVAAYLIRLATPLAVLLLALLVSYLGTEQILASGAGVEAISYLTQLVAGAAIVWIVWTTATWIAETIIDSPRIAPESLDANLVRLAARAVGILAVLVIVFRIANDVGIPVYGLVAGAGVGGLAVALAARSTLENFMGALNLFADRPVRVGDLCRYDEDQSGGWRVVGKVESIGLRSVKIRKFDRSLVTIPNGDFAQKHILNLSSCDRFLLTATIGLRYETTDDQLRHVLAELRELLHAHPKTIHSPEDPVRVRFVGFGDYSLDVAIRAYLKTATYNEFLAIQEDILLRLMKVVKRSGTGFAFPSRTLYLGRDSGLDDDLQQEAEHKVREWASAQTLPFPDFTEDYRKKITDTLDYPPEGSPDADRG